MTASSTWDVSRGRQATVVCDVTGEVLAPGTPCRSVLVPARAQEPEAGSEAKPPASAFERVDVSQAAWDAGHRPAAAVSHWQSRVPDPAAPRREPLDLPGLVELLGGLVEEPKIDRPKAAFRFVLALLLMRRRMLRLEDTRDRDGETIWRFTPKENPHKGPMGRWAQSEIVEIPDPNLDASDAAAVAEQLRETLGVEG